MICPSCGHPNLPGADQCGTCSLDLAALDRPAAKNRIEGSLLHDRVGVLRPNPPATVPLTATLGDAVRVMMARGVGAVLVTAADGTLAGILTERDFLTKVAGSDTFAALPVRQFMTADPETAAADEPLAFALRKMDVGSYRHLPVVSGGVPVGVVSVRDVLRHVLALCPHETA